jgi:hypothetical protein
VISHVMSMVINIHFALSSWVQVEHGWTMEAFELLLDAWVVLLEDPALGLESAPGETPPPRDFDVEVRACARGLSIVVGRSLWGEGRSNHHHHHHHHPPNHPMLQNVRGVLVRATSELYGSYLQAKTALGRAEAGRATGDEEEVRPLLSFAAIDAQLLCAAPSHWVCIISGDPQ